MQTRTAIAAYGQSLMIRKAIVQITGWHLWRKATRTQAAYVAGAHGQQSPQGQKEKLCRG